MSRLRNAWTGVAVAGLWIWAGVARGGIVVRLVQVAPSPGNAQMQTLAANGWTCWVVRATGETSTGTLGGYDLSSANSTPNGGTVNHTGKDWGIFVSNGFMAQRWSSDPETGNLVQSTEGVMPSGGVAASPDSHYTNKSGVTLHDSEDNNLLNGVNPPFDQNPIPDGSGGDFSYGVGTFLKATRTVDLALQVHNEDIAQLWLSPGSLVTIRGLFDETVYSKNDPTMTSVDQNLVDMTIAVPEAGTAGMLGVGVVMLMKRGRRAGFVATKEGGCR